MDNFYKLAIAEIEREIGGAATSVIFTVPPEIAEQFHWNAGQHLTLRVVLEGVEQRRCYTISNPPGQPLRITAKRVKDGRVSNHIADTLKVGDTVDVMPPFGGFKLTPDPKARRTHYFFGGGSGITPLYAMINAVLEHEPHSVAHLIYGNTNADSILFAEDFDALAVALPERFTLRHILSSPSMWSWFQPWRKGRVDAEAIAAAIEETPPVAQDVQYWICGPSGMNAGVKAALMGMDVPAELIHFESFGGATTPDTHIDSVAATAQVTLGGTTTEFNVARGQTLLEAMRNAGLTPPFSCQSGVCGACQAHLSSGEVHMSARMALEDRDVAKGQILTCQSRALSERLSLTFPE